MKMSALEKLFVNSPSHSRQVSTHAKKLLQRVPLEAGQKYLDVGCGNGAAPVYIAQKYPLAVTGIDVDPDQILHAQKLGAELDNVRFLTVDSTDLPFEPAEFDIVFTNKVMHHIPNWPEALAEMVRVLKPGGYLIYADLVFPGWVATVGQRIMGQRTGFPTKAVFDSLLKTHRLSTRHRANSPFHEEGVFQKSQTETTL